MGGCRHPRSFVLITFVCILVLTEQALIPGAGRKTTQKATTLVVHERNDPGLLSVRTAVLESSYLM